MGRGQPDGDSGWGADSGRSGKAGGSDWRSRWRAAGCWGLLRRREGRRGRRERERLGAGREVFEVCEVGRPWSGSHWSGAVIVSLGVCAELEDRPTGVGPTPRSRSVTLGSPYGRGSPPTTPCRDLGGGPVSVGRCIEALGRGPRPAGRGWGSRVGSGHGWGLGLFAGGVAGLVVQDGWMDGDDGRAHASGGGATSRA